MLCRNAVLAAACAVTVGTVEAQETASPAAIRNVTVIDGSGGRPLTGVTVLIRGARIEAIGPAESIIIPAEAHTVDGSGRYLIPGLIDTHAHIRSFMGTPALKGILDHALAHGITGVREASGMGRERDLVALRDSIAVGAVLAPRLYVSGSGSPQNVPRHEATGLADLIRRLHEIGVDGIKLRNLTRLQADTVIAAARGAGLPVFGHTYGPNPIGDYTLEALSAGVTGVMHVNGVGPADSLHPRTLHANGWERDWLELHLRWLDADADDEARLVRAFLRNGAWLEPTLTIIAFESHDEWFRDRPETQLASRISGGTYADLRRGFPAFDGSDMELAREGFKRMQRFVRSFHQAGGVIVTGSDMAPWLTAGIHEELRLLVDAGLSPLAALQAATRDAARVLGWAERTGTIAVGLDADLVLLDADPLADINNTRRIRAVVRGGRILDRAALDALLAPARN